MTDREHEAAQGSTISDLDAVIVSPSPSFTPAAALEIASASFAVRAGVARSLGSERDQAFLLSDHSGTPMAVMKVANAAEDTAHLDMEAAAVEHALSVDPQLPLVVPWASPLADRAGMSVAVADRRVEVAGHWVRMYDVVPGATRDRGADLSDRTLGDWGELAARVAVSLRSFTNPAAVRVMPWDVQRALATRPMVASISDAGQRELVRRVLDRFEDEVAPRWRRLRAQVIHGDMNLGNVLVDQAGVITGVVDFGDMCHSALVADLAAVIASLSEQTDFENSFRIGRLLIDGYSRVTPLEQLELDVLTDLVAARQAAGVAITAWRESLDLDGRPSAASWRDDVCGWLDGVLGLGWDEAERRLSGSQPRLTTGEWQQRRDAAVGAALEPLSYDEPVHLASAFGVWMFDVEGRALLDAYNNVACVGHSHPRVAGAVARQSRILNTNMRYLHSAAVELAERLIDSVAPGLDTVLFVNSGTEANDLAWRLATHFTGATGGLCTSFAYHGISQAMAPFSPETLPMTTRVPDVETWHPTDTYRQTNSDSTSFNDALQRLNSNGHSLAAAILDGVLQSDGVHDLAPALVQDYVRQTRAAGGLWIADEVQGGHGRTGSHLWSYERFGIEPDFVTLGKPMGNGFPVAAVITRSEIAAKFREHSVIFSTFGGNPVAAAAGLAVLDVIDDEKVIPRVAAAGEALRAAVRRATTDHDCIGDLRGIGLANGIEIVESRSSQQPDREMANRIKNRLRAYGVLVGTTGPHGNVLKVRPPLAFTEQHVPVFVGALVAALADVTGSR